MDKKLQTANCELSLPRNNSGNGCFPWSRFWTALGMFLLFLCALIVVLQWNPEPLSDDAERALLRSKNLTALQSANKERLESYGWVDQTHGVLHIPITRAMELEVVSLNDPKWKPHAVTAISPIDLVPKPAGVEQKSKE